MDSWFCQHLGIAPTALAPYATRSCSCQRQPLDADHLHTCTKHSGNWHNGHEHLLTAVEAIAQVSGYRTARGRHMSYSRGQKRGDHEIKNLNVAGTANLIIDTCMVHDFHGSTADVAQHGGLRHHDPKWVFNDAVVKKIVGNGYRQDYLQNHNKAFLPLTMSTSGRLHGEFVRLLYLLAHRRSLTFFASLGYEPCYEELCQRRGAFFFQHRALIGLAGAQAVSLRMGGNAPSFANDARQRPSTTRLAFNGWTWTIFILIFPRIKLLFEALYVYVYVYVSVCMCFYGLMNPSMVPICLATFLHLLSSRSVNKPPYIS
jgi:hypothetical protein